MEAVCVKLDERIIKSMDSNMRKHNYSTRTDFIREAIRDKLRALEKEKAISELRNFLGSAKAKVSDKRHEQIRDEVAKEFAEKFGIKLD
ncbi:MAG: ribbon-helix-helix domain-containing protein [Candidatus Woesearchaeota archaeon]